MDLGFGIPHYLKLYRLILRQGDQWKQKLIEQGFNTNRPAVVASTGVAMYLTREANLTTLKEIAKRYFANRTDGLLPASGEEFLIAQV